MTHRLAPFWLTATLLGTPACGADDPPTPPTAEEKACALLQGTSSSAMRATTDILGAPDAPLDRRIHLVLDHTDPLAHNVIDLPVTTPGSYAVYWSTPVTLGVDTTTAPAPDLGPPFDGIASCPEIGDRRTLTLGAGTYGLDLLPTLSAPSVELVIEKL